MFEHPAIDVLIASRLAPTYAGGLAAYQRGLAEELEKPGLDLHAEFLACKEVVPATQHIHRLPSQCHLTEGRMREFHGLWMRMASRPMMHGLLEWMIDRAYRPALLGGEIPGSRVVHFVGTGWDFTGFALARHARRLGARFTVWPAVHPGQWGDDKIDLRLYRAADAVFCQSNHEASHLVSLGLGADKIVRCGLPPMCLEGRNGDSLRRQWGTARPVVLFLGRRDIGKGYPALMAAWPQVLQTHPSALLLLAGPAEAGEDVPKISLPPGSYKDLGLPDEETKARALAACDVFCLPSAHESFGIVYAEAWSYGKPVICGPAPAAREWIQDGVTGFHTSQNPTEIADVLNRLLADRDLRHRLGEAGRNFQRSKLTWQGVTQIHLEAFGIAENLTSGAEKSRRRHLP